MTSQPNRRNDPTGNPVLEAITQQSQLLEQHIQEHSDRSQDLVATASGHGR